MKNGVGVAVGRFQVDELHPGHLAVIEAAAEHPKMLVILGQHPFLTTRENPLDFQTRRAMIQYRYPDAVVFNLLDCASDEEWSKNLDAIITKLYPFDEVRLYCGRGGFAPHYKGKYRVVELDHVAPVSGTDIREYVGQRPLTSADFRRGIIYATRNQYPNLKPAVDIAAISFSLHTEQKVVLLGRKEGETSWRFPGGFVDSKDESYEAAAKRELFEETKLTAEHGLQYIGSFRIEDWRRTQSCGIFSAFYVAHMMMKHAVASDDLFEVRWFEFDDAVQAIAPAHKPLLLAIEKELACSTKI